MSKLDSYCALRNTIGMTKSKYLHIPHEQFHFFFAHSRTKVKLRSSELVVSGEQWPIFLYENYTYDPEDPWRGLLRSALLVKV